MNILFFHSTIWSQFFSDLLLHYQIEHQAKVTIASPRVSQEIYRENVRNGAKIVDWPDLLVRQPFEESSLAKDEIETLVAACEAATGKSANRVLLAAERDLGQGYSKGFFYWPRTSMRSFCSRDNKRPHLVLLRLFAWTKDLFEKTRPDCILSRDTNGLFAQPAWFLAARFNIPFLTCRFSKALSKRAFWTDDFFMYNTRAADLARGQIEKGTDPSLESQDIIAEFRNRPITVDYIRQNWLRADASGWLKRHWDFAAMAKRQAIYYLHGQRGIRPKPVLSKVLEYYRILVMKQWHARFFSTFKENELATMRYAYLPLHKEPELMINFESPLWHDQRHAVKYVASMLPAGCRLLVKEHRFNWGRRYTKYLKFLTGIPNVTLIHPFDSQFKYIQNASLIVTDNGSSGWEGLILKKPVVTLEQTFYDSSGLAFTAPDPRVLDQVLLEALRQTSPVPEKERDARLCAVIDAERATSMEIETMHADPALSVSMIDHLLAKRSEKSS